MLNLPRSQPESPQPAAPVEPVRPKKAAPAPKAETPPPAPEPPRTARRAPAPKPEAPPPPPPPAPVETAPEGPSLHIDADVPGAQVFVDRIFLGATPLTTRNVAPGKHRLNASAPGYEGISDDIEVVAGSQDVVVRFKEVRLNANINVVHKHRFGSCKGRLVATPAGLRYETTEKGDAFSVPLLDMDTFEVDYLEKNLRLKLRNGKRLDFTDPEGNADHLFVFHRDVDKARERLKKGDTPRPE